MNRPGRATAVVVEQLGYGIMLALLVAVAANELIDGANKAVVTVFSLRALPGALVDGGIAGLAEIQLAIATANTAVGRTSQAAFVLAATVVTTKHGTIAVGLMLGAGGTAAVVV